MLCSCKSSTTTTNEVEQVAKKEAVLVKEEPKVVNLPIDKSLQKEVTWLTDMNEATKLAIAQKKPVLLFFTGSDWCGWCTKLQNEVLKKEEFTNWAAQNVVLVELDFPKRKQLDEALKTQNQSLQRALKVSGYPTIWFVNPEIKPDNTINLKPLGSSGYVAGGPDKWLAVANGILKK